MGPQVWVALYQQSPSPADGKLFKRQTFRYFTTEADGAVYVLRTPEGDVRYPRDECWTFATMDLAASSKQSADYTVVSVWGVTPHADLLVLAVVRARFEGPDQLPLVWQVYGQWLPAMIGIEAVAYQLTLVQQAVRAGLPALELRPDRDKVARALPMAARYTAGTVYHRRGADWLEAWEREYLAFPNAANDDQVDTGGYAAILLAQTLGELGDDDTLPALPAQFLGSQRGGAGHGQRRR